MNNEETTIQPEIDRLVHEPARLKIMLYLAPVREADFRYLLYKTKLSRGNLSVQLHNLEAAGYIQIDKQFVKRIPHTIASLTDRGRKALKTYKDQIMELFSEVEEPGAPTSSI